MNFIEAKETLLKHLTTGAIVITPNNRLSHQLLQDFFKTHQSNVQEKPICLPYPAFLRVLFQQVRHRQTSQAHLLLLTPLQQHHLWQKILKQADHPIQDGLLHEVQEAWARCQHWQINCSESSFAKTQQTRQFQQWQQQFQQALDQLGAITQEQIVTTMLPHLSRLPIHPLIWACFNDFTPQQRTLQQALTDHGHQQYYFDLSNQSTSTYQYAAKDPQDEYEQMIHWLKSRLRAGERRIAVVVPDLQTQSRPLQRWLQRQIPAHQFNISLGESLADYPLVAHALTWLSLDQSTISNQQARLLLHSPYLSAASQEFTARAQLMQDSKILQETIISFPVLLDEWRTTAPKLVKLLEHLSCYPEQASPNQWIMEFKKRLKCLGFPGEYPLNSSMYQCFQRFMTLLDELLQLSLISPNMTKAQALEALRHLAKSTIFQLRQAPTPIQILGLLEASGCTFDSIWVSGMTDQCLPQKINLSAFIPIDLQREKSMPHALPAQELKLAKQLLKRLQNGSQNSVFSYPRLLGDSPNRPTPLIQDLPPFIAFEPANKPVSSLIPRQETYRVPLVSQERLSGGTALLANQAKCPFRAFAKHRLHAKPGPNISTGPNDRERGQLIHQIMDKIWIRMANQQQLLAMTHNKLDHHIERIIKEALTPLIHYRIQSFSSLVQEIERSRLKKLVHACLDWEKQRPPFSVEGVEKPYTMTLAGLDFQLRIDRLDQVGDKKWVIDYKSTLPNHKPWHEDRPEEPQLLLYALLARDINVLLFLQLKAGRLICSGFSEEAIPMKGMSALKKGETWSDYQMRWRDQLNQLAEECHIGHCPPQPKRLSLCQNCDFPSLCRMEGV